MNRLEQIAEQIEAHGQPPVDTWKPKHVGEIDIKIDSQGFWFHEGDPISRDKLVALFASILWAEDDQHFLVTPAEKLKIQVQDVPYVVHQAEFVDGAWVAVTNTHEQVIIGESNPVQLREYQSPHQKQGQAQWVPYVNVRYDLWARVNRSIYYQWVEAALEHQASEGSPLILSSQGYEFEVARV